MKSFLFVYSCVLLVMSLFACNVRRKQETHPGVVIYRNCDYVKADDTTKCDCSKGVQVIDSKYPDRTVIDCSAK